MTSNIDSDIDISNFVASDCTVTNGTRGALTINSVTSATLRVTAGSAGTMTVAIAEDAVDPGNAAVSQDFTVNAADLSFGSETIANQAWVVGTAASVTLPTASGGVGTITYSLTPTLPAGKTFVASTRVLSGTPTGRFTSDTFTYTATAGTESVTLTFTIVVTAPAITFDSGMNNQTWTVGTAVSLTTPTLSGGVGTLTYSITPALPAGVTFTAATRLLSGTPTAAAASATYTYTGTDEEGISASRTFTIVVAAAAVALSFGSSAIANQSWVVGTAASVTLPTATGGEGTISYSLSPTLPSGATFVASTRVLSGNPTAVFTSDTFTYTAEDADGTTVELTFTIVVAAAAVPLALGWTVPTAPVGNTFSATLTSNHPITGVELNDFRFRISDNSEGAVALTAANTTLTAVAGTNNWQLDIVLVGTFDADYTIRLRGNTVQYDGSNYPPAFLFSDAFSIDSSIGADTVPEAPTSLTATAQTNGTSMALDWDAPNNDGGAAISDYDVSSDDGATWNAIGSTNTTYTVTGLDKGTEYTFRVRAVNSVGDGTASASVTETTETTVPGAPTSLASTPAATSVALTWTAPTDTGGENITDYELRYQAGSTAGGTWTSLGQTTTSYTQTGLDKGTEYTFQVRAVNDTGNSSGSNADTETTDTTVPGAPTSLSVAGQTLTTLTISWTDATDDGGSLVTGHQYRLDGGSWVSTGSTTTTHIITSLTSDTEYSIEVRTQNSVGNSSASTSASGTTTAPIASTVPGAPTSFSEQRHKRVARLWRWRGRHRAMTAARASPIMMCQAIMEEHGHL